MIPNRRLCPVRLHRVVCGAAFLWACASRPDSTTISGFASGLYYEESGSGEPLVLIHGFSLDRRMWEPQMDMLDDRFRVIRYDLRGHGRSVEIADSFAAYEDLRAVLDAAGAERAVLLGLSAGSQIAVDFAVAYPDRVDRLILAGPSISGYVPTAGFAWMAPVVEAARAGKPEEAARLWAETTLMAVPTRPSADSLMRSIVQSNSRLWSYTTNPDRGLVPPAIGRLNGIDVPVLVIVGERDLPDIQKVADTLVACVPRAKKRVVTGAGHLVNLEVPEAFNEAVLEFLQAGRGRESREKLESPVDQVTCR